MLPRRLRRLPLVDVGDDVLALEARGFRARLLGLAFVDPLPPGLGLLIPRCRSVHTCGMRFELDLAWYAADGDVFLIDHDVEPGELRWAGRHAAGVLELPAGHRYPERVWPRDPSVRRRLRLR